MEKTEYWVEWAVYKTTTARDEDFVAIFDTKEYAKSYLRINYPAGKIRCCCSIDESLAGLEYGYGDTKAEALRNLKAQVKEYGYLPYDPYKSKERVKKKYTREDILNATRDCTDRCAILNISENTACLCVDGEYYTLSEAKMKARLLQLKERATNDKLAQYVVVDRYLRRIYRVR